MASPKARSARFFGYYPGTVALVTCEHAGARNVMSAGWHSALSSDPPLYGVALGRGNATNPLVSASGRFGLNFLPFEHARTVQGAGVLSLADGVDKFERLNLTADAEEPLALEAAYLAYVCDVDRVVPTGDHDWFVGSVREVLYDANAYDERRLFRGTAAVYLGRSVYVPLRADERRAEFPPAAYE